MWEIKPPQVSLGVWHATILLPYPLLSGKGSAKMWPNTWQMATYHWPWVRLAEALCAPVGGLHVYPALSWAPVPRTPNSVVVTGEIVHTLMIVRKMKALIASLLILMTCDKLALKALIQSKCVTAVIQELLGKQGHPWMQRERSFKCANDPFRLVWTTEEKPAGD